MGPDEYVKLSMRTKCSQTWARDLVIENEGRNCEDLTQLFHGILGMAKEAGELLNFLEKEFWFRGRESRSWSEARTQLISELGDVCWYMALVLDATEITMSDVLTANVDKLKKRYPNKFTEEDAAEKRDQKEASQGGVDRAKDQ